MRHGFVIVAFSIYRVRQKSNPLIFVLQFSQQSLGISKQNFTDIFNLVILYTNKSLII